MMRWYRRIACLHNETPATTTPVVVMMLLAISTALVAPVPAQEPAVAVEPAVAEEPTTELVPIDLRLLGAWEQVEPATEKPVLIELTRDFYGRVEGDRLVRRSPVIGQRGDDTLVISLACNRVDHRFELEGDRLVLARKPAVRPSRREPESERASFRRLAERPSVFELVPLELGDPERPLAAERLAEIRAELEARGERDQEIRRSSMEPDADREKIVQEMKTIDAENVSYLVELISEIGWIDAKRFGPEASTAAWLIVQHSGDLALMKAVLPQVEKVARASNGDSGVGSQFALLWDRSQIWLGHKQRYGSQVLGGPDGMFIAPLEDPATVDERRAALGLGPLDEYREFFRQRNDGKPLPIRHDF